MKVVGRFELKKDKFWGLVDGERVIKISSDWQEFLEKFYTGIHGNESFELKELKHLAPVIPTKIIALGLNYKDHSIEMSEKLPDEPLIFMKPSSAVIGPEDYIIYPQQSERVDYEAELGVVIGRKTKNVRREEAMDHILGFTCFNDVTARDLQRKDGQWTRAKSFDTFAPIGPYVVSGIVHSALKIKSYVNGKVRQDSNTSFLIFDVPYLIEFISSIMTLYPGDVIATGTPAGVGPLKKGDTVTIEIEGIGKLTNFVR